MSIESFYWEVVVDNGSQEERADYDSLGGAQHAYRMALLREPFSVTLFRWNAGSGVCDILRHHEAECTTRI